MSPSDAPRPAPAAGASPPATRAALLWSGAAAWVAALVRAMRSFFSAIARAARTDGTASGPIPRRAPAPWAALARALIGGLGRVLAPDRCASCDEPARADATFCERCAATVVRDSRGEGGGARCEIVAHARYGGAVARAVRRFKYEERPDLAGPLGRLLGSAARGVAADLVVPVPLHPRKLRARGYNQAALLATAVARELGAPLGARVLARTRDTPAQAHLDRAGRLANLDGAFHVRAPAAVRGRRVVLVDDVCTTGSTLGACRAALLAAGAKAVTALVLARADKERA